MTRVSPDVVPRFGANLKAARVGALVTQHHLAAGMRARGFRWTASTVYKAEQASRRLYLDELDALSGIVGVPLDRMLTETPARVTKIAKARAEVK